MSWTRLLIPALCLGLLVGCSDEETTTTPQPTTTFPTNPTNPGNTDPPVTNPDASSPSDTDPVDPDPVDAGDSDPDPGPNPGACEEGKGCNDKDLCTYNDVCTDGVCAGTPVDCDDGAPCTDDVCDGGVCSNPVADGSCLVDGICWTHGQSNPQNACERCLSDLDPGGWSPADGVACGSDDPCSQGSCVSGECVETPVVCEQDDNSCTESVCVGGACEVQSLSGQPCDDGDPCTSGETCDKDACTGGVPKDVDNDGFIDTACGGDDCDDDDPTSKPAAMETLCEDAADNDCDLLVDEADSDCAPQPETCTYHTDCYPWGICGLWTGTNQKVCSLPCAGDADCAPGQLCTKAPGSAQVGFCQDLAPGLKGTGAACASSAECQTGLCEGTCLGTCMNEVHCPGAGMTCFATGDLAAGQLTAMCGINAGIGTGQICGASPSGPTFDGAFCSSGHCDLTSPFGNYVCSTLCRGEGDCGAGQECNMVILGMAPNGDSVPYDPQAQMATYDAITACYSPPFGTGNLPVGSVCQANTDCTSNKCLALAPGNPTKYCTGFCTHDNECPATMACKPELINGVSDWLTYPTVGSGGNVNAYSLVRICKLK